MTNQQTQQRVNQFLDEAIRNAPDAEFRSALGRLRNKSGAARSEAFSDKGFITTIGGIVKNLLDWAVAVVSDAFSLVADILTTCLNFLVSVLEGFAGAFHVRAAA